MKHNASSALLNAFQGLRISALPALRPLPPSKAPSVLASLRPTHMSASIRLFSSTACVAGTWLEPNLNRKRKMMKGRPRVATGGSTLGTTIAWGDYGLRMRDHHRRISAHQLKIAEDTIKQRLRGQKYRLYKRVNCNVGVFVSGNDVSFSILSRRPRDIR